MAKAKEEAASSVPTTPAVPAPEPAGTTLGGKPEPKEKKQKTVDVRGRVFDVVKTTRDRITGVIYDHYKVVRNVTDGKTNKKVDVELFKRERRPGTGIMKPKRFEVIEEEVEE
jgi:hypothetical protein